MAVEAPRAVRCRKEATSNRHTSNDSQCCIQEASNSQGQHRWTLQLSELGYIKCVLVDCQCFFVFFAFVH